MHFGEHTCVVALWIDIDGAKDPVVTGRGLDGERHPGHRTDRRAARARPGRHPPDPRGARRVQGAAPRGAGCVRPAGDRPLPLHYADVQIMPTSVWSVLVSTACPGQSGRHNPEAPCGSSSRHWRRSDPRTGAHGERRDRSHSRLCPPRSTCDPPPVVEEEHRGGLGESPPAPDRYWDVQRSYGQLLAFLGAPGLCRSIPSPEQRSDLHRLGSTSA